MPRHDFTALYAHYPSIIAQMPETFTSHQFILQLARQHQRLYVEALYAYRDVIHRGAAAPFMVVHNILAKHLGQHPDLIELVSHNVFSTNILGGSSECTQWKRRSA
jgi:fructose-1,6-bisphosphatase